MPAVDMVAVMADTAVGMAATASDMPRSAMLRAGTARFVSAVDVATVLLGMRADSGAMQDAHMPGIGAALGEVIMIIRTMVIPDSAITVTVRVGTIIHTTDIIPGDTIPTDTDTDTGRT